VRRSLAAAVATALVLAAGSVSGKRAPLLATVWKGSVVSLTRVDPMSLRPIGEPSLPIGGGAYRVAQSPRGAALAFDTGPGAVLSFVDLRSLRVRGSLKLGDGWIGAAAWPSPRRLVAVVGSEGYPKVVTVDPATRRQLAERRLPFRAGLLAAAATANRVVFLLADSESIAPVRLGLAGVGGAVRTVVLDRIDGGTQPPQDYSTGVVKTAAPALAVDPSGKRAAVVAAGGLVGEVDLDTFAVTYHPRAARSPARAAKAFQGWRRSALLLPNGTLAVTGMDYETTVKDGAEEMSGSPAGVTLVDTRDWSSNAVDDGASSIARAGDRLVAYGGPYVSGPKIPAGIGLRGYAADGTLRFWLFGSELIGDVQVAGGLVYVATCSDRCFRIVDPASGAVVGTTETPQTTQLVGS